MTYVLKLAQVYSLSYGSPISNEPVAVEVLRMLLFDEVAYS